MPDDLHHLQRFVDAQAPVFDAVRAELAGGRKRTHWMWFVFPQLKSLGRSGTARFYGLEDAAEAAAYWRHPLLGQRLKGCCELLLQLQGLSAHDVFGSPDDLKLRSCMTLFEAAAPEEGVFGQVLARYCAAERDPLTRAALGLP